MSDGTHRLGMFEEREMSLTVTAILCLATAFVSSFVGFLIGASFTETWIREAHYWRMRAEDGEAKEIGGRFGAEVNRG